MSKNRLTKLKAEFRALLNEAGLSQRRFALLLGCDPSTVNRWWTARPDALDPPIYAVLLLRCFAGLGEKERAALLKWRGIAPRA